MAPSATDEPRTDREAAFGGLTLRQGGWVLLLAGALVVLTLVLHGVRIARTRSHPAIGDGRDIRSYRFDLDTATVPLERIVASGLPRDGLPALDDPPTIDARTLGPRPTLAGVRKLHGTDRVLGVRIGGTTRAYPLWILAWHEVVNDTLAGVPILVTYNPLSDAAVVFDRRVAGRELRFGFSGLLYNSNLLVFDRQPRPEDSSLWSQLRFEAVAGPAAARGDRLTVLPCVVTYWKHWRTRYPETSVLLPLRPLRQRYRRDAYKAYFGTQRLRFPVSPLPPADSLPLKTPVVATLEDGRWRVRRCDRFELPALWDRTARVHAFWFAWYAMHPDAVLEP